MTARRFCDGAYQRGELRCTSFAPGVIEGPYRAGWRQWLRDLVAWLMGPQP